MKCFGENSESTFSFDRRDRAGVERAARCPDLSVLALRCGEELRSLSPAEVRVALTVLRAMAKGEEDVSSPTVAQRAGFSEEFVERVLGRWPASEVDPSGSVLAFWGISREETPHKVIVEGTTLFAWCAWDSLVLPELLDADARIESTCPVTSKKVRLDLAGECLREAEPPEAVMSLVKAGCTDGGEQVYQSFCQHVHFLATSDAGCEWLAGRGQRGYLLSLDQAWELARRVVSLLPDAR